MKFFTLTYIMISLILLYGAIAQRAFAESATPEPQIVFFPSLLINEVNLKNSQQDSFIIEVTDDGNEGMGSTIKGLKFKDDSVFFEINKDIYIRSGEKILISLKNEIEEIKETSEGLQINLTKSGLTGTTEQLILIDRNNIVIDAVCWANDNPTISEKTELEDLFNKEGWASNQISSCINSDEIATNQSIVRKNSNDTNSKDDWELKIEKAVIEETDTPEIVEIEDEENEPELKICDENVFINEFLPNPLGKDSNQEWIEIMNSSGADCSLYGWEIDDQEGGSTGYKISSSELVQSGGYLLLPSWATKLNLNNAEDLVRLFNQNGKLIDEISYKNSPENQSYALNTETGDFLWTKQLTPLFQNVFPEAEIDEDDEDEAKKTEKEVKIPNGTLSDEIYIMEVFPNPKGQDKGLEWIEIFNDSGDDVKLGNWKIETSSKSYAFENITLGSQEYLTISDETLGFALKNSDETFILKDYKDNEISAISYENVVEAESFMKIENIENEITSSSWTWTDNPTPGEKNHTTYTYTGIVSDFNIENSRLKLSLNSGESNEEILDISVLLSGDELTESIFTAGTQLKITVIKDNDNMVLEEYEVLSKLEDSKPEKESNNLLYIIISSLPPIGFLGYSAIKKFGIIKIV